MEMNPMACPSRSGQTSQSTSRFTSDLLRLAITALALSCSVATLTAQTPAFTFFNAADAGSGAGQGTVPAGINQGGIIAGYYVDSGNGVHGFVRTAAGVITEFNATGLTSTYVNGINGRGQIVGSVAHPSGHTNYTHGYLRNPSGNIILIDPAGPNGSQNTFNLTINDSGEIAGTYVDVAGGVLHGFLRSSGGTYTVVDEPNAENLESGQGTVIADINANGEVTGFYNDANTFTIRGFIRDQLGNFTVFDAPGAGVNFGAGTFAAAINLSGEVAGTYVDDSFVTHSFVRDSSGSISDYDAPSATNTYTVSLNDGGEVLGWLTNSANTYVGFERNSSGSVTEFSVPVSNTGTNPMGINDAGHMTGYYYDLSGSVHGFVR
jgi:hypothetical protein